MYTPVRLSVNHPYFHARPVYQTIEQPLYFLWRSAMPLRNEEYRSQFLFLQEVKFSLYVKCQALLFAKDSQMKPPGFGSYPCSSVVHAA